MNIGDLLDNFKLLEILGKGGQGIVYKALDTKLNRLVALKVFSPELNLQKRDFERFEREAKLASTLDHPNISTIYSLFEHEGYQCIAMQYVEGKNLHDFAEGRPLEIKSALHLIIQVAEALVAAHKQNIVHRDIKARNVMVTPEGHVMVLDFGLAKLIADDANEEMSGPAKRFDLAAINQPLPDENSIASSTMTDVHLTERGEPYGTPASSAPEMALGEAIDFRADIFSIGVLLYLLLTGKFPFPAKKIDEVRDKIVNQDPVPVDSARNADESIPPRLENALHRALEKNPEDRFQTAAEMRDELLAIWGELEDKNELVKAAGSATLPTSSAPIYAVSGGFNMQNVLVAVALISGAIILIWLLINFL